MLGDGTRSRFDELGTTDGTIVSFEDFAISMAQFDEKERVTSPPPSPYKYAKITDP